MKHDSQTIVQESYDKVTRKRQAHMQ